MPITNAGATAAAKSLINDSPTFYNNANAHIGVGDSTTAFSAAHTDLQAPTNKLRKGMDSGYPTIASNVLTFRSTFTTSEANYAWAEWGTFNALSGGSMFTRKVEAIGTKANTQTWQATATITVAAA